MDENLFKLFIGEGKVIWDTEWDPFWVLTLLAKLELDCSRTLSILLNLSEMSMYMHVGFLYLKILITINYVQICEQKLQVLVMVI